MKAEIEPLDDRKYYGTEVSIADDTDAALGFVTIWIGGTHNPSHRELARLKRHNGDSEPTQEDIDEWCCDSHYETETSLHIAELLVLAVNNP